MGKTTEEALQLLNDISENAIQWPSECIIIKKVATVNQVDALNTLTQQIISLAQKFESFQVNTQQPSQSETCDMCEGNHLNHEYQENNHTDEQVHSVGYKPYPFGSPMAQKHPGFQWRNSNGAENSTSFQKQQVQGPSGSQNQNRGEPNYRPYQQAGPYQQSPQQAHSSLDELLYKYIKVTDENMESQGSALKNLEMQLSQLATLVSEKIQEKEVKKKEENNIEKLTPFPVTIPFPQKLKRENLDNRFSKFLETLKQIHINIPFPDALLQMPSYAKFIKEILSSKRKLEEVSVVMLTEKCSAILQNKLPQKLGDSSSFTIPCSLGGVYFEKALCNSGASINLMPFSIFRKLNLGEMKDIGVSLQFADQSTKKPKGIIENVLVRVDTFVFPIDFIVLEMKECHDEPIILGRPFLSTGKEIINVHQGQLILRVDEERVNFDMQKILRFSGDETSSSCFSIDMLNYLTDEFKDDQLIPKSMERCLAKSGTIQDDDPIIRRETGILEKDSEEEEMQPEQVEPKIELKVLPYHLKYVYLKEELFLDSYRPIVQPQRRLNPAIQEVVKKEIVMLLVAGYTQIPIAPEDQNKTTFTCPHGTYAYRRMPFGLCNVPTTFQRCMSAIFSDMTENFLEIFMEDFTLFRKIFEDCLHHLTLVLKRCEEANLILNWEKYHFMVIEGIVLGHKITAKGIEVDKAKIDVI
ncbi:uncharacterized protein [Nicotiana sylvestris]|uniref:uncharacterized protein n=1 Tax=Nicotiana sylvestris TaxID=4096 RepID=UPI00388CB644